MAYLAYSPLFTAAMMELTKLPKRAKTPGGDPLSGAEGEDEEAQGGIANMRVVNASKVTDSNFPHRHILS